MIDIKDKHDCCGCTACASICGVKAIRMQSDEEGFSYPKINASLCTDCGLCERVCPIIQRDAHQPSEIPLTVFGLHNKDAKIWESSSSGGVFAALTDACINNGGIVYGAEYNDDLIVVHKGESTKEGALRFRGSKYVQSDMTGIYREIRDHLRNRKEVLFSGVPCQVEGLKNFLIKRYDNLTTVDIICHGVPSPLIFSDYIKFIRKNTFMSLEKVFMKDKTFGWGYQNLRLYYKGGVNEFNTPVSNLWNKIFYDHIVNRPACHKCRFKNLHRAGDLTIGDFWKIEKSHPDFTSDKGISLLLVNTPKGKRIWADIRQHFDYRESNTSECMQPALGKSYPEPPEKAVFWNDYFRHGFNKVIRKKYNISSLDLFKRNLFLFLKKIK